MNRNEILETFFEAIKDSTEWGFDCDDKTYGYYIDGVVAMTDRLLEKLESKVDKSSTEPLPLSTKLDSLNDKISYIPDCCVHCSNHPSNGGSGICNCTLPYMDASTGISYGVTSEVTS